MTLCEKGKNGDYSNSWYHLFGDNIDPAVVVFWFRVHGTQALGELLWFFRHGLCPKLHGKCD